MDDSESVGALVPTDPEWQPIFQVSNQVVLYNPTNHAISIRSSSVHRSVQHCPYCKQVLPSGFHAEPDDEDTDSHYSRASNYFHLLAVSNETWSRPSTPPPLANATTSAFSPEALANGYFNAFFVEEQKLGMGANGSVYLCQVTCIRSLHTSCATYATCSARA